MSKLRCPHCHGRQIVEIEGDQSHSCTICNELFTLQQALPLQVMPPRDDSNFPTVPPETASPSFRESLQNTSGALPDLNAAEPICSNCDEAVNATWQYCPHCQTPLHSIARSKFANPATKSTRQQAVPSVDYVPTLPPAKELSRIDFGLTGIALSAMGLLLVIAMTSGVMRFDWGNTELMIFGGIIATLLLVCGLVISTRETRSNRRQISTLVTALIFVVSLRLLAFYAFLVAVAAICEPFLHP